MDFDKLLEIAKFNTSVYFKNRSHAGLFLVNYLMKNNIKYDILAIIPKGGLEIAMEIRKTIYFENFLIVPSVKIGAAGNTDFGIGSLDIWSNPIINKEACEILRESKRDLKTSITRSTILQHHIIKSLKIEIKDFVKLVGKKVLLVDDGISTGYTMFAAIKSIQKYKPYFIHCIVPVMNKRSLDFMSKICTQIYSPIIEALPVFYVDYFYETFDDINMDKAKDYVLSLKEMNAI